MHPHDVRIIYKINALAKYVRNGIEIREEEARPHYFYNTNAPRNGRWSQCERDPCTNNCTFIIYSSFVVSLLFFCSKFRRCGQSKLTSSWYKILKALKDCLAGFLGIDEKRLYFFCPNGWLYVCEERFSVQNKNNEPFSFISKLNFSLHLQISASNMECC